MMVLVESHHERMLDRYAGWPNKLVTMIAFGGVFVKLFIFMENLVVSMSIKTTVAPNTFAQAAVADIE
jgi:hypothetical protein